MNIKWIWMILLFVLMFMGSSNAQTSSDPDSIVSIVLKDGSKLSGTLIEQTETIVIIKTINGLEIKVPQSSIVSIRPIKDKVEKGVMIRSDPNYSRLMFSPTGRPLKKGEGYFSDYYVLFPGISYGFTDHFSMMAGFSIVPGINFSDQLKYLAPRIGFQLNDVVAVATGALYISFFEEVAAGIAYGVVTVGEPDRSVTAGLGFGYVREEDEDFEFAQRPILMLGGNVRLSNSIALVTENWFYPIPEMKFKEQPFAVALRFFGERLAVDAGIIFSFQLLEEGFPMPWLSFVYHFGN
ncbi:hypothetical protein JXB12_01930 [candidate division KSB1 bacterium]|nr:hypothetical protein [candidate division KSB1 bacterium]